VTAALVAAAAALAAAPAGDLVLDPSAWGSVTFGNTVNVASYQQDGLLTHRGRQYTAWYGGDGRAWVARRRLPGGTWEKVRLRYRLFSDDSHDAISMGFTPEDDRLHVAFPTHAEAIRYTRTVPGVSRARRWRASLFERVRHSLPGAPRAPVTWTYPQFEQAGRRSLLTYRDGRHDDGRQVLLRYRRGRWRLLGRFTESRGTWGTSTSRYAYLHGFTWNAVRRRLEIAFTWRERSGSGCEEIPNHDLGYAWSADGLAWHDSAGTAIGRIAVTDPHVVLPIPSDRGLINQETQAVDSRGRFHVVTSLVPGTECVRDFYAERGAGARPQHTWRDERGAWHTAPLPALSGSAGRTKLLFGRHDTAIVVLPDGRLATATERTNWTDWQITDLHIDPVGEVTVDRQRIARDGVLSIAYQRGTQYRVLDIRVSPR
jgi:hypothetical protein